MTIKSERFDFCTGDIIEVTVDDYYGVVVLQNAAKIAILWLYSAEIIEYNFDDFTDKFMLFCFNKFRG